MYSMALAMRSSISALNLVILVIGCDSYKSMVAYAVAFLVHILLRGAKRLDETERIGRFVRSLTSPESATLSNPRAWSGLNLESLAVELLV